MLGNKKSRIRSLLNLFADKSTEEAEIIATLFAAWNDLLIDGRPASGEHHSRGSRELTPEEGTAHSIAASPLAGMDSSAQPDS